MGRKLAAVEDNIGVELGIAMGDGMEDAVVTRGITEGTVGVLVMAKDAVDVGRELTATGDSTSDELESTLDAVSIRLGGKLVVVEAIKDSDGELLAANVIEESTWMERELAVTGTTEDAGKVPVAEDGVVITGGARSDTVIEPTSSAVSTEVAWSTVEVTVESVGDTAEETAILY